MSDVTIEKALEMKKQLERDLHTLIHGYEQACSGIYYVDDVTLFHSRTVDGQSQTISVCIGVEFCN
jgi:hypothetical protein